MTFLKLYVLFIALCFLVSLIIYVKPRPNSFRYLRYFPPFLLATFVVEAVGVYLGTIAEPNTALYNFFSTFEFCFYLWVIGLMITNSHVRKLIWVVIGLYCIAAVCNILFVQGIQRFHTTTYALGCLVVVVFCIYYFFELFRQPQSVSLKANPAFWICSGLLFFYCCSFPLFGLISIWAKIKLVVSNFSAIVNILNIFLYSLFTIAFLCSRSRKYTSSLS